MPIILFFLSFVALAADPNCDVQELEKQCYASICSTTQPGPLPLDEETLNKELAKFPYTLPKQYQADRKEVEDFYKILMNRFKAAGEAEARKVVDEEFNEHGANLYQFKNVFANEMYIVSTPNGAKVFFSDVGEALDPDFKKLMITYYEMDLSAVDDFAASPEIKKIKAELKAATGKDYSHVTSALDDDFATDYNKFVAKKLAPYKEGLVKELTKKIKNTMSVDITTPEAKKQFTQTCKTSAFFQKKLASFTTVQLGNLIKKVVGAYRKNFFPKISKETAKTLSKYFTAGNIQLIGYSNDDHLHPIIDPADDPQTMEMVSSLAFLRDAQAFNCNLDVADLTDHFRPDEQQVYISKLTLATGREATLAHELGHFLSHLSRQSLLSTHSTKKLETTRKCVQGFYPDGNKGTFYSFGYEGDTQYTEEDFADFVAANVIGMSKPLICELEELSFVKGRKAYKHYEPSSKESHSSGIFREIHERLIKGQKISPSCTELMNNSSVKPVKCSL